MHKNLKNNKQIYQAQMFLKLRFYIHIIIIYVFLYMYRILRGYNLWIGKQRVEIQLLLMKHDFFINIKTTIKNYCRKKIPKTLIRG